MRKRRKTPEQDLQKAVAGYLRHALRSPTIWTAIGHGGGGALRGAILKGMGVQPGWPDILILHPEDHYTFVLGIELKAKGSLSPEQKAMVNSFATAGAVLVTCRSIEAVEHYLTLNGVPLYASVSGRSASVKAAA